MQLLLFDCYNCTS